MGKKAKTSRKGKKAWRANISTEDIGDFFEKSTKDALSGGSVANLSSDSLFFVDKSRDLSVKRKIEKHREKALKYEVPLQKNPFVQAVPSSIRKKSKSKAKRVAENKDAQNGVQSAAGSDSQMTDLWGGEYNGKVNKMAPNTSVIPAVEIEPPGCSFNPSFNSHQDSLARAVADEMQKVYKEELGPEPVPLTVMGQAVDEEDMYFLDADDAGSDDDDKTTENLIDGESQPLEKRSFKVKPVTRVELNKRARRKETLKKEAETKKVVQLSKEIDSVSKIMKEIEKEDKEKQKRHLRRVIAKEERLKARPPRLGKHKFEAAPMQVLLSEEITGSMRQLKYAIGFWKGCCTLAKDRFKSLEKRGIIVPTGNKKNKRG